MHQQRTRLVTPIGRQTWVIDQPLDNNNQEESITFDQGILLSNGISLHRSLQDDVLYTIFVQSQVTPPTGLIGRYLDQGRFRDDNTVTILEGWVFESSYPRHPMMEDSVQAYFEEGSFPEKLVLVRARLRGE